MQDMIQSLIIAGTVGLLILVGLIINSLNTKKDESSGNASKATEKHTFAELPSPFGNWITMALLMTMLSLLVVGVLEITTSNELIDHLIGLGFILAGSLMWVKGNKIHKSDPLTAGVITVWGKYVHTEGKPAVVGGRTLLAPYIPFNIKTEEVELTQFNGTVKDVKLFDEDKVPLQGTIAIVMRPKISDIIDYIAAGKSKPIGDQMEEIATRIARNLASKKKADAIFSDPKVISEQLLADLREAADSRKFGIEVVNVQTPFSMASDFEELFAGKRKEELQREVENLEYETNKLAALKLLEEHRKTGNSTITLADCLEEIRKQRAMRDGKFMIIDGKGMVLNDANLNMGGKK